MTKGNQARKGLVSLHLHVTVHHWRKSRQELKAGTKIDAVEGHHVLVCSYSSLGTQDQPPSSWSTASWTLSFQSSIEKMHHRLGHKPIPLGHFLNWDSLFQNSPDLCQVEKKLANSVLNQLPKTHHQIHRPVKSLKPHFENSSVFSSW